MPGYPELVNEVVLLPPQQKVGDEDGDDCMTYQLQHPAWHASFSSDGTLLAVCYGAPHPCIRIWTTDTWQLLTTLDGIHTRTIRCVAFAPLDRPRILASASFDGTITIWMQQTNNEDKWDCLAQLEGHDNEVKSVAWNATASLLATSGRDKTVWIWECFLPGAVGGPAPIENADGDFECVAVLNGHEADVKCVKFAASHGIWGDGDCICISASYDNTIRIWAEDDGDWYCAASIDDTHASTIWTLTVAPSGRRFISGSADGSLAIYKCFTADEFNAIESEKPNNSNNGHRSTKSMWKCVGALPDAHTSVVYSVDYAPARVGHGRIVSGGADNRINVYREALGSTLDKPLIMLDAVATVKGGDINCVCWHPWDGSVLVSTGDDGSTRVWKYHS